MNQNRAPLFEALDRYVKKGVVKLHVPGHKYGAGLPKEMGAILGKSSQFDLSVLEDIDSLSHPQTVIKQAQALAARAFGADETFFLINGSTLGVQAMILATCSANDKIIVSRNSHQSVTAGLILSGARPIYLQPEFDEEFNLPLNVKPETVQAALKKNPDAKAVLIISPTQFGVTADIKKIAKIVHDARKILLVDEAWGAQFKFHPEFPLSALSSGADMVVQSTHKRLPALSQTSMLHIQGGRVDKEKVQKIIQMLQTTSPSYILLSSLDSARREMVLHGKNLWEEIINLTKKTRSEIKKLGFRILERKYLNSLGFDLDLTNITIEVENGFTAWKILNKNKIEPEFATLDHLIIIVGIGNNIKDSILLMGALKKISPRKNISKIKYPNILPKVSLSPKEALERKTEEVGIKKAIGRISAQMITPYPPGIPLLIPGEVITRKIFDYLNEINEYSSVRMQILGNLKTISVVK
ncbi:MAG: aminotransferase class I/II-fold pyridoxal phosphate-dependent enzyme [bacterium]|nr:aminotransferase class I/II-fold pyridoxal phosphate-dependent enzyme [bacterium]